MQNAEMLAHADTLFTQAERRAERTISLLRIGIAAALGTAFFVAVDPTIAESQSVLTRQWIFAGATLGSYFVLGVVSYIANLRGYYRPWISWLTVTGDSVFLLAGVYSSLVNTGLAANFATGMPSIWLIPVILAFGSLRYNPNLQIYQIGFLVVGLAWIASQMGWDSSLQPQADPVLFYFFAGPPNLMRLAMVLLAGLVLVVAAVRTRNLLIRAIGETQRSLNLTRFLPGPIADRIASGGLEELRRGSRRDVSVLFVDIRDFTRMSETMEPEAVGEFITEFRRRISRAAGKAGGTIDKFIGDAALIVFGLVDDGPDDADQALMCARLIAAEMDDWNDRIPAGVATTGQSRNGVCTAARCSAGRWAMRRASNTRSSETP